MLYILAMRKLMSLQLYLGNIMARSVYLGAMVCLLLRNSIRDVPILRCYRYLAGTTID